MPTCLRPALVLIGAALGACGAASQGNGGAPSVVGSPRGGMGFSSERMVMAEAAPVARAQRLFPAKRSMAQAGAPAPRRVPTSAPTEERYIVRSAYLRLERDDPEEGVKGAAEIAKRQGGWVQRTDNTSATLMVPADRLDAVLAEVAKLGKVAKREVRGEDVTEEYLDLRIRLDNLEKARARYLELLARAASVTETLGVEKELERVTSEIERLKGRMQYLERVVRFSTVVVTCERPVTPGPVGWIFYALYHGVKWLFVWE